MTALLLVGGGGHCRSVIDVIESGSTFSVRGIIQPVAEGTTPVLGYPILGDDNALVELLVKGSAALVTVGQIKNSTIRRRLYEQLSALKARLPVLVSPHAYVSRHAELGAGSVVLHGAIVNAAVQVGANAIINTLALLEHDVVVGEHCHVATGARVNGGARIGDGSFIGSGAIIYQGVCIGENSVIAAGAVVSKDVPAGKVLRRVG
jgi:sugar O-acyltransferase (sialic acid O-acetyltransferase NeuD family)